jgi:hypothetical protein
MKQLAEENHQHDKCDNYKEPKQPFFLSMNPIVFFVHVDSSFFGKDS